MPGKKHLKMGTSREIRKSLNRVVDMLLNGEIDAKTANALLYGCNVALGAIRVDEQESRIETLERIAEGINEQH